MEYVMVRLFAAVLIVIVVPVGSNLVRLWASDEDSWTQVLYSESYSSVMPKEHAIGAIRRADEYAVGATGNVFYIEHTDKAWGIKIKFQMPATVGSVRFRSTIIGKR